MTSFRQFRAQQNNKQPAKQVARSEVPYPNIITQVNKEDEKKMQILDFLNIYKCCSFLWKCFPSKKQDFTPIVEATQGLLEPQLPQFYGKKTLVLDLDETLVHSSFEPCENPDIVLPIRMQGSTYRINVMIRPGTEEFLARMGELYEVVVFTASLAEYAEPLVKMLDTTNAVSYLLYRQHCTPLNGVYVKDLSLLGRDMKNVILIDNSPNSFLFQPENAYHIKNFFEDKKDRELTRLTTFLENIATIDDVRPIEDLRKRFEPPHGHHQVKFVKVNNQQADQEELNVQINESSKAMIKKKEEREKVYSVETEPDLRRDDREEEFPRQYGNFSSKAMPLTERIVVNDRFVPSQPLDISEDIELPSPKESDGLINHREADAYLESNSNSSDSDNKKCKDKPRVPPLAKCGNSVFANNGFVAVVDPTLNGQKVDDVRFLTGVENLNSPLGRHVKIDLDNNME